MTQWNINHVVHWTCTTRKGPTDWQVQTSTMYTCRFRLSYGRCGFASYVFPVSNAALDTVIQQWGKKTYSCYGSRQTLTLPSDSVLCLGRTMHTTFLSDTTHSLMVKWRSVMLKAMIHYQTMSYDNQTLCLIQVSGGHLMEIQVWMMVPVARQITTEY